MAGEQVVERGGSSEQEVQSKEAMAGNQVEELQRKMKEVVNAFEAEADKPELLHGQELTELFKILKENNDAVPQLPPEKKGQLAELLPKIAEALKQCAPEENTTMKKKAAAAALKMSDWYPFRTKADANADGGSVVSPLLEQTKAIFEPATAADAEWPPADEVLYEWTTSYVDEERLYGWHEEAKEVAEALVGGEDDDEGGVVFRAAGIYGIHGSGKTALAQRVFVHDLVKDTFPLRLWVCVGPQPDDMATLLYRMLDNLGLDTYKVEEIVNESAAVKKQVNASAEWSKIGVLLFILHVTLAKTSYLIVFDDVRAYDEWYTNLPLPPPADGEWSDRLAYGLPKKKKSAVLVTCRKEEHARAMVRTGRVFHPPPLHGHHAWTLFRRQYTHANNYKDDSHLELLEKMQEEIVAKCLGLPVAIIEAAKGFAQLSYQSEDDGAQ
uniref:NB-ARC domain-containing protein n=1 Tax=Leersia perrieri TaxID=77586 RepID=A0A0D9WUL9_9ORYZ